MITRPLRIGELAKLAGVSTDTLRYYERMGLLSGIARTSGGYRQYPASAPGEVQLIRNAMRFGFSLKQVAQFLRARELGHPPCQQVRNAGEEILARVNQQIKDLKTARISIRKTLAQWDHHLSKVSAGQPARLLQSIEADTIETNCLSRSVLRSRRTPSRGRQSSQATK